MKKTLKGMNVAYSGTFGDRSRSQLSSDLRDLGASASNKINTKTDLFIKGNRASSSKVEKARMSGVPIIDLKQLEALFGGAKLKEVLPSDEDEAVESRSLEEVLIKVRELLAQDEDWSSWKGLCDLFDETADEDIDTLLDYVVPHTESWATEFRFNSWWGRGGIGDVREAPQAWMEQMLTGRDSKKMQIVRVLNLNSKKLVGKVASKLFDVSQLDNLLALDVGNNKLPAAFFKQLADSGMWSTMRYLSLAQIPMRLSGWEALASATQLTQLTHLNLTHTKLDDDGLKALLEAEQFGQLTHLNLESNVFTAEGIKALAASPLMANLRHLYLGHCRCIDAEAAEALASSPHLQQLEVLQLNDNPLGPKGMEALAASSYFRHLKVLKASSADLNDRAMKALSNADSWESLERLELGYNKINDKGIESLVNAPFAPQLVELELHGNIFGNKGAECIANTPHLQRLEQLQCATGKLNEQGAIALIKSKNLPQLNYLWLGSFSTKSDVAKAIKHARHLSKELRKALKNNLYDES